MTNKPDKLTDIKLDQLAAYAALSGRELNSPQQPSSDTNTASLPTVMANSPEAHQQLARQPLLLPEGVDVKALLAARMEAEIISFMEANAEYIDSYMAKHPESSLPITYGADDKPKLMNRAERRARGMS